MSLTCGTASGAYLLDKISLGGYFLKRGCSILKSSASGVVLIWLFDIFRNWELNRR